MSQVIRTTGVRHAIFGLALAGLAMSSTTKAIANDFDVPAYRPYPNGAVEGGEICRIFHERRVDPYGRITVHRIRMCDEGQVYPSMDGRAAPSDYRYAPPPRYYAPSASGYDPYPRPPAPIGPTYYN